MWASGLPDGSANSPWHAYNPRIGVADGKVAICYRRQPNWYDALHAHVLVSDDLGVTFSDTAAATAGAGGGWDVQDFVFDGDLVAVMYLQQAYSFGLVRGDLYMAVSGDGGATFRPAPISVPTSSGTHKVHGSHDEHYSPVVAVDSGRVHAVWRGEDGADTMAIFYRRTTDAGVTWDAAQNLTAGTGLAPAALTSQCTVVADGDLVFAFIHTSAATLYLRKSVDGGASFGDLVEVTDPVGQSLAGDCWWPVAKRGGDGAAGRGGVGYRDDGVEAIPFAGRRGDIFGDGRGADLVAVADQPATVRRGWSGEHARGLRGWLDVVFDGCVRRSGRDASAVGCGA